MIEEYETVAKNSGAKIVHTCGFDSIPSDLGTYFLQKSMMERFGVPANHVKYRSVAFKGGFSGGTADSMIAIRYGLPQGKLSQSGKLHGATSFSTICSKVWRFRINPMAPSSFRKTSAASGKEL